MKHLMIALILLITNSSYAIDWTFGIEGATVFKEPVMGFWFSGGPVLFGIKTNFAEDVNKDRDETPSMSYGPGGYLNNKNYGAKSLTSYNLNLDVMYFINPKSRASLYVGGYVAKQEFCPTYWTSDINYFYNCPKWENKKDSGLDLRFHYDVFQDKYWSVPLAISTTSGGDFGIGIGWKWNGDL